MNPRNPARLLRRFLPIAAAAAVGAAVGVAVYTASNTSSSKTAAPSLVVPAQPASTTTGTNNLTQIYQQDTPGVVDIQVTSTTSGGGAQNPFNPFGNPGPQKSQAEGTGFVIDTKGDILTAQHVVAGASSITVQFSDGTKAKATLVGSDKTTDTAVIHVGVPASELNPLTLGDSSSVQPGDAVVAIGSPFGLTETMTAGIVSAVNRTITAQNNFEIPGAIQTDAAINHGNSGGPLIDVSTNTVIGINDQIESDTNDNAGVGFAVPINASKNVASTLISGGTVQHAYLGVLIGDTAGGGAKIRSVKSGTPAAKAGLKAGDVITKVDGKAVANSDALIAIVSSHSPGQTLALTVSRGGATKQISVTLGTQPS